MSLASDLGPGDDNSTWDVYLAARNVHSAGGAVTGS